MSTFLITVPQTHFDVGQSFYAYLSEDSFSEEIKRVHATVQQLTPRPGGQIQVTLEVSDEDEYPAEEIELALQEELLRD